MALGQLCICSPKLFFLCELCFTPATFLFEGAIEIKEEETEMVSGDSEVMPPPASIDDEDL